MSPRPRTSTTGPRSATSECVSSRSTHCLARSSLTSVPPLQIFMTSEEVLGGLVGAGADDLGEVDLCDDDSDDSPSQGSSSPSASPEPPEKRRREPSPESSDDGVETDSPSASGSGSGSPAPSTVKGKGKKRDSTASSTSKAGDVKKQRARAPKGGFKSAEFIADSDDSSHELPPRDSGDEAGDGGRKKGKGKVRAKGASEGKGKGKKKERKVPEPKEGDAARGTGDEENRIKKLKVRLIPFCSTSLVALLPFADADGPLTTLAGPPRRRLWPSRFHRRDGRRAHPHRRAPHRGPRGPPQGARTRRQGR